MKRKGLYIIWLYADSPSEWNCSEWRAKIPSDALNAAHEAGTSSHRGRLFQMATALNWKHPQVQKQLGLADVIVFQRNVLVPEVWDAMDYFRAIGKTITVDLDDHYPDLPPSNPAYDYWIRNLPELNPEPTGALTEGMKHADALTSPSKVILKDWEHIVPGYWLPNWTRRKWYESLGQKPGGAPDYEFGYEANGSDPVLSAKPRENSEGWITLGWGGSISHVDSWLFSGIMEALDRVFEKYPQARLKFCGHEGRLDTWLSRYGERVIRQVGVRPDHWPQVVATFDIGLAPLDTRPLDPPWREGAPVCGYDERRSWLKGAEYLTAGVPWVGSRCLPYQDLARWGKLVENTPDAWFAALDNMIERLAYEKQQAWERRRWALKKITLEGNIENYGEIMGRIMTAKHIRGGHRLPEITYVAQATAPVVEQIGIVPA